MSDGSVGNDSTQGHADEAVLEKKAFWRRRRNGASLQQLAVSRLNFNFLGACGADLTLGEGGWGVRDTLRCINGNAPSMGCGDSWSGDGGGIAASAGRKSQKSAL